MAAASPFDWRSVSGGADGADGAGDADGAADFPEALTWKLVSSYLERHGAVRHQLESYDHFTTNLLPHIITENSDVSYMHSSGRFLHHLHFCNVAMRQPTCREADGFECPLMPHMARLRGFTYGSLVMADLVHDKVAAGDAPRLESRKIYRNVVLCRLPVMLHSRLCHLKAQRDTRYECALDRGGYFIVNGVEKALLGQEKLRTNFPYVFPCRAAARFEYVCEVRSCHELKMRSTSTLYIYITRLDRDAEVLELAVPLLLCEKGLPLEARVEVYSPRSAMVAPGAGARECVRASRSKMARGDKETGCTRC